MRKPALTWTTPPRYILMSIWFFCHFGLEDGSTSLGTNKGNRVRCELAFPQWREESSAGCRIRRCNMHFILVWVFIRLQVEDPLHGHVNISDAEQDQSIEHCRQDRKMLNWITSSLSTECIWLSKQFNKCFVLRSELFATTSGGFYQYYKPIISRIICSCQVHIMLLLKVDIKIKNQLNIVIPTHNTEWMHMTAPHIPELSATLYRHRLAPSPLVVATAALKAWVTSLKRRGVGSFLIAAFHSSIILSVTLIASLPFLDFFDSFGPLSSSSSLSLQLASYMQNTLVWKFIPRRELAYSRQ